MQGTRDRLHSRGGGIAWGWHKVALEQFHKLSSALARHTGQDEDEKFDHLVKRVSILLQKGLASMLLNRTPGHPAAEIDGLL